ncbi:MAG: hypothetical protein E7L31_15135 [Aeromonas sp.]|uniref:hypothetical protein n=1 Tax=Aeromonas caviae TaxID=648 RepID=UPI00191F8B9E|nr:hypothetical protein [Aeromonas caviae]MBL0436879.1 hypothetical protein [Aeromonas caviae]MDU7312695.1 hypothetical protein [Aeromonas sp.]
MDHSMDFGIGLSIGESGKGFLRGQVAGWKEQAVSMEGQLNEATQIAHARTFSNNGAVALIQEMLEEIRESNPTSPFANRDFLRNRLKELAMQKALQDGYVLDYDNDRVTPKP